MNNKEIRIYIVESKKPKYIYLKELLKKVFSNHNVITNTKDHSDEKSEDYPHYTRQQLFAELAYCVYTYPYDIQEEAADEECYNYFLNSINDFKPDLFILNWNLTNSTINHAGEFHRKIIQKNFDDIPILIIENYGWYDHSYSESYDALNNFLTKVKCARVKWRINECEKYISETEHQKNVREEELLKKAFNNLKTLLK